jgi:hypothetical protein
VQRRDSLEGSGTLNVARSFDLHRAVTPASPIAPSFVAGVLAASSTRDASFFGWDTSNEPT